MKKYGVVILSTALFAIAAIGAPPASSKALIEKGKAAFTVNCVVCHGEKGDGNGPAGAVMNPKPRNFATDLFKGKDGKGKIKNPTPQQVFDSISSGVAGTSMAPFASIPVEDRWGLVYYVLSFRQKSK